MLEYSYWHYQSLHTPPQMSVKVCIDYIHGHITFMYVWRSCIGLHKCCRILAGDHSAFWATNLFILQLGLQPDPDYIAWSYTHNRYMMYDFHGKCSHLYHSDVLMKNLFILQSVPDEFTLCRLTSWLKILTDK